MDVILGLIALQVGVFLGSLGYIIEEKYLGEQ